MMFPSYHQFRFAYNKSWLNSVWIGTIWTVLTLPEILIFDWLLPIFARPSCVLVRTWATLVLLVKLPVFGLLGRVTSENVSIDELQERLRGVQ
jgi:hypothetical protein